MNKLKILFLLNKGSIDNTGHGPRFPLGPFRLEAFCRDIADFTFLEFENNFSDLENREEDIIAVSTSSIDLEFMIKEDPKIAYFEFLIKIKKASNKPLILGGNLSKFVPELENYVDWSCYYDGEKPLRNALLFYIENKKFPDHFRERAPLSQEELDTIPPIDVSLFNTIPIQLSIGCRNHCRFCISPDSTGRGLRHYSLSKIKSDIDYYTDNGIKNFFVVDDDLYSDEKYYTEVFEHFASKGASIISPQTPIYISKQNISTLLRVTSFFNFSPDACNERLFKLTGKKGDFSNFEKLVRFIRNERSYALIVCQLVVNYPEETDKDREEAIEFYSSLPLNFVRPVGLVPIPGTKVHQELNLNNEQLVDFLKKGLEISEYMMEKINSKLSIHNISSFKDKRVMDNILKNFKSAGEWQESFTSYVRD